MVSGAAVTIVNDIAMITADAPGSTSDPEDHPPMNHTRLRQKKPNEERMVVALERIASLLAVIDANIRLLVTQRSSTPEGDLAALGVRLFTADPADLPAPANDR